MRPTKRRETIAGLTASTTQRSIGAVRRVAILVLMFCVTVGFAVQQPAQALAGPTGMTAMSADDVASMPDCMDAMQKDKTPSRCKCGLAGCIAMMASSAPIMLAGGQAVIGVAAKSESDPPIGVSRTLRGRSTAPEPDPPTA
jgi:hypothetical protein